MIIFEGELSKESRTIGGMGGGDMLSGASMLLTLLPFMQIILYFLFMRPAKKMKEKLEILLCLDGFGGNDE